MTKTKFKKYSKNGLKPIKKYLIYKALLNKKTIREISKEFNCSFATILKIKKRAKKSLLPFIEIDNLKYLIYKIKEQNPFYTLKDIQNHLKEHYKMKVSISTISNKLKNYKMKEDILELFKKLIEDNEIAFACEILKYYKLEPKDYYLLEKLPDDYLPIDAFVSKIIYLIENEKLNENEILKYKSKADNLMKIYKNDLNYYYLLLLKIYILHLFQDAQTIFEIYKEEKEKINKLPLSLKIQIKLYLIQGLIRVYPKEVLEIASSLIRIKKDESLREDLFRIYVNLGYLNKAKKLGYEPILEFLMGNYKNFIKLSSKFLETYKDDAQTRTYYKSLLMESKIFNNISFSIISKEIEEEIRKYPVYKITYNGSLALKYAIEGDFNKVKELLRAYEGTSNIIKAILSKNHRILSRYRKQELLVKYLIKGNLKRAVEFARKYHLIYNLHFYSILLNKSIKRLKKYKEFKRVVNLIRKNRKFKLRVYILKKKQRIYVNNKLIRNSKRFSKMFLILYYLINSRRKIVEIKSLLNVIDYDDLKNVKSYIFKLNHMFGFKLFSIEDVYIKINDNCKIYFDLNDFERTKNKKLIRCLPFSNFYDKNKFASDVFSFVQVNWR
jgi:transposase